jgi:carbonic anhydrase
VKGACDDVRMGNLTVLLNKIRPAVDDTRVIGERNSSNNHFVESVALRNVELAVEQIRERSPILKELASAGRIGVVGGMYDVQTGLVQLLGQ